MRKDHITLTLALAVMTLGCNDSVKKLPIQDNEPINFSKSQKIPEFPETERIEKIQETLSNTGTVFEEFAKKNHLPGIAFGIVVDHALVHSGGYGTVNLTSQHPVTDQSLFRIASMTKSFTAMAILKLWENGMLSLADPAAKIIPELAKLTYLTEDATPITINNLLTMTAGFPEDNPWGDRYLDMSDEDFMKLLGEGISFSTVPSHQYEYSNLGYGILGNIITRVSGMPYQQYITKSILEPLGMNNTYWEYSDVPDELLALGYRWEDEQWKEEPMLHDGAFGAMGGLITSIEDFSKYVSFHLSAWPERNGEDTGPVTRSTLREMQRMNNPGLSMEKWRFGDNSFPVIRGYGFGLVAMKDHRDIMEVGHNGGLPGFGSSYLFYPEYGIGIMAFCNLTYAGGTAKRANYEIIKALIEQELFKPRVLQISDILAQRKEQVVELIKSWDPALEKEILAKNFFMDRSREDRMEDAGKAFTSLGEIVSIEPLIPENQLRGSFIMKGTRGSVEVFFTLTPESTPRVQWLSFHPK
ncbi:MAG: serine hydrolase domain-containing protein [Bacteroidota bacterium]